MGKSPMALAPAQLAESLRATGTFLEKRRPPLEARDQLDFRADITGADVFIIEERSSYREPGKKLERPIAKASWVTARSRWRLYWMRPNLKWESYAPLPDAATLDELLEEVHRDPLGCFFG